MVNFTTMSLSDIVQELTIRLGKQRSEHLDYTTIVVCINRAIQEVCAATLQYKEWYYVKTLSVSDGDALPLDFLKVSRVICSHGTAYSEARYADPKEFNEVDYWKINGFNRSTNADPVYTIWGGLIYLSPSTRHQTGVAPNGYYYSTATVTGKLEYYAMPTQLAASSDAVAVPYDYWDYIILAALRRLGTYLSDPSMILNVQRDLGSVGQKILNRYMDIKKAEARQIDSFVEPVPPVVPVPPQEGEARVSLI